MKFVGMAHVALLFLAGSAAADETFFREQVAPLLESHCLRCHSGAEAKGELNLANRKTLMSGGESGAGLVPGNPDESLLIEYVSGDVPEMPKNAEPLSPEQVAVLRKWISDGAEWPTELVLEEKRQPWWSLEPLVKPVLPEVTAEEAAWCRTPIDRFIIAKLRENELAPSEEAGRRTLIRRLSFDLCGLPPTPDEVNAFLIDSAADAYERLVERLLASPHYGERWARHWLDVVHYADTHGYDKDKRRPHAWPYRDYVIRSFNDDKPFANFARQQLAGDVLEPGNPDGIMATGFLVAGPWDFVGHVELKEGTVDKQITRSLDRDDMVSNAMSTFASLTVHCARCHDHKFDPVSQRDYYSLQAVFAGIERANRLYEFDPAVERVREELLEQRRALEREHRRLRKQSDKAGETGAQKREQLSRQIAELNRQLTELPAQQLVYAAAATFYPVQSFSPSPKGKPRPVYLLHRGNVTSPGELMSPGAPHCVEALPSQFTLDDADDEGQRRRALADWMTDEKNPLSWRSYVNRLWHYHFGRGLVDTPNDFGRMGTLPTHPELLDWLAAEFRDSGGMTKKLHRLIVTSSVYRQVSSSNELMASRDAGNRHLWRMNRRRLEAEAVRDAVLRVSGSFDSQMYGPGFDRFGFIDDHSPHYNYDEHDVLSAGSQRRTVYRFIVRSVPDPFMQSLDCADPSINVPVRNTTITPVQALSLLNNPFMVHHARRFAGRLRGKSDDPTRQIELAYRVALGRASTGGERGLLVDYVREHGLENFCRLIFNTNEFSFVD